MDHKFRIAHLDSFYPIPHIRIQNPIKAAYEVGDRVKILVGPATGTYGIVIVDRNANYEDPARNMKSEDIGVRVPEKTLVKKGSLLEKMIKNRSIDPESLVREVIRWFDNPKQLELEK